MTQKKANSEREFTMQRAVHEIELAVEAALRDGKMRHRQDPGRVKRLRISSFPYCPIEWFLGLPRALSKGSITDISSAYFTTVGTAVHNVVQGALEFLVKQEQQDAELKVLRMDLIADWECRSCKHIHPLSMIPAECAKCGSKEIKFEEVTLEDGVALGHVDTIFQLTLSKPTEQFPDGIVWLVIDYKTTMLKKVRLREGTVSDLPYEGNKWQIRGYVGVLHKMGKPVFPGAFLVYVPRDNPFAFKVFGVDAPLDTQLQWLDSYQENYEAVASASNLEEVLALLPDRPCADKLQKRHCECKWKDYCAGPENTKRVTQEITSVYSRVKDKMPVVSAADMKTLLKNYKRAT